MGTISKSFLRFFFRSGKLVMENETVSNFAFEGEKLKILDLKNCTCRNVTFRDMIGNGLYIENCAFINCRFENVVKLGGLKAHQVTLKHSTFTECSFDQFRLMTTGRQNIMDNLRFENCKFYGVKIETRTEAKDLKLNKCEVESLDFKSSALLDCKLHHLDLKDVVLDTSMKSSEYKETLFRNFLLLGESEKNYFIDCEMAGYRFMAKENS